MDGLQGIEHGPSPAFDLKPDDAGYCDSASSKKNMRLILAGRNAVAVDTVEALVMKCGPKQVPHLTKLEADGLGTTDVSQISVVGNQIAEIAKPFACKQTYICPGAKQSVSVAASRSTRATEPAPGPLARDVQLHATLQRSLRWKDLANRRPLLCSPGRPYRQLLEVKE